MCAGFAAYLLFTRPTREEDGKYYGDFQGKPYPIRDDAAAYFFERWSAVELTDAAALSSLVHEVLGHASFWDQDLLHLGDFRIAWRTTLLSLANAVFVQRLKNSLAHEQSNRPTGDPRADLRALAQC